MRDVWLTNGTPQNTADDTQIVAGGAVARAAPRSTSRRPTSPRRTATRIRSGARGSTFTPVGALYNQAFEDYIVAPVAQGGLGGVVTAAQYPEAPSGVRRITILGDAPDRTRRLRRPAAGARRVR